MAEIVKKEKNRVAQTQINDLVHDKIEKYTKEGRLALPEGYNVGNALQSAWLIFTQDQKLMSCTRDSIAQSLLDMALLGLDPSLNQVYFMTAGTKAVTLPSYMGKVRMLKRINGVKNILSDVIYEGTDYELTVDELTGMENIRIIKPCPIGERNNEKIIGAWARIILDEEVHGISTYTTIMSIEDIRNSWSLGGAKGNSLAHKKFTNEMAKKSAISRCVKMFVNTFGDEQNEMIGAYNRSTSSEYEVAHQQPDEYEDKIVSFDDESIIGEAEVNEVEPEIIEEDIILEEV